MLCPDDSTTLERVSYEGEVPVDQCGQCGGIWLDHGELQAVQDIRVNDYSSELDAIPTYFDNAYDMALARTEGVYSCPKCEREMEKREYAYCSQVMIDVCPGCRGIWLHQDELSELEIFFEKSRADTKEVRKGFLASLRSFFTKS